MRVFLLRVSDWVGSVAKIGYLPLAPGTWASAVALLAWYFLPNIETLTYALILLNLFLVGVIVSAIISNRDGEADPSCIVIDEWVGMWIALASISKEWTWMVLCFLLFRFFDIVKVFPVKQMERIRGGWGIMLDDVVAGIYALVILVIVGIVRAIQ